jgi:alpha-L-rhamnosidase
VIGGLAPGAPGYRRIRVAPTPGGGLTWAATMHDTPYGRAEVSWRIDGETFRLDVVVPPGVSADVTLPGDDAVRTVGSGAHSFACPAAQVPVDWDTAPWGAHDHL